MKPAEYKILNSYTTANLTRDVEVYMAQGFYPIGGVTVSGDPTRGEEVFYQAIYRQAVAAPEPPKNTTVDKPGRHTVPNPEEKKTPRPEANCTISGHKHKAKDCPDRKK